MEGGSESGGLDDTSRECLSPEFEARRLEKVSSSKLDSLGQSSRIEVSAGAEEMIDPQVLTDRAEV